MIFFGTAYVLWCSKEVSCNSKVGFFYHFTYNLSLIDELIFYDLLSDSKNCLMSHENCLMSHVIMRHINFLKLSLLIKKTTFVVNISQRRILNPVQHVRWSYSDINWGGFEEGSESSFLAAYGYFSIIMRVLSFWQVH